MVRKVDTEGAHTVPARTPEDDGDVAGPLLIEIPLWKFGRIKLESFNSKSSLAVFALVVILAMMIFLSVLEAGAGIMKSTVPGIVGLQGKVGEALLLILGVLLGAYNGKSKK
ncbi:hypothetical protein [Allorhizobium borbori]|uniref:Uncharacterized protein n=1 Tax=Allorhizobium borbori TaxID=485907 RepID=A0A7W6K3W3_9HYPH|nr:hypothetical protein [Allorhizobium borbori]MBB4103580.1 hypothetical protein [Allorhizobium borbori]